ncbi:hypothetical protein EDD85DRAFT_780992, partial [Armillaria nabsnona]
DAQLVELEHIYLFWIVHRDIKPESLLCALDDSAIKIVDFDISKPLPMVSRAKTSRNRNAENGSLHFTPLVELSFYSYAVDLASHDDLESVADIALFLLCGTLPWKSHPHDESQMRSQVVVQHMKPISSGKDMSSGFLVELVFSDRFN